jgi:hypothetical protein
MSPCAKPKLGEIHHREPAALWVRIGSPVEVSPAVACAMADDLAHALEPFRNRQVIGSSPCSCRPPSPARWSGASGLSSSSPVVTPNRVGSPRGASRLIVQLLQSLSVPIDRYSFEYGRDHEGPGCSCTHGGASCCSRGPAWRVRPRRRLRPKPMRSCPSSTFIQL